MDPTPAYETARAALCARPFIRSAELRPLLPWGRTKFYERIHQPDFPAPVDFGDGGDGEFG